MNYPVFAAACGGDVFVTKHSWPIVKLFKSTDKKSVKFIAGSNTRRVTQLFFNTAKENGQHFTSKCLASFWIRRFFSVDHMQRLWAAPEFMYLEKESGLAELRIYREIFKRMQPNTLLNWFCNSRENHYRDLRDTADMIMRRQNYVWPERIRSIKELHDSLIPRRQVGRPVIKFDQDPFNLECPRKVEKLDGLKFGDYEIKAPKSSTEMEEWGQKMSNYIGSYAYRVRQGQTIILGVLEKSEIKYGMELDDELNIVQFRGRFNQEPEKKERTHIKEEMRKLVKIKDFKFDLNLEAGVVLDHEVNVVLEH